MGLSSVIEFPPLYSSPAFPADHGELAAAQDTALQQQQSERHADERHRVRGGELRAHRELEEQIELGRDDLQARRDQ